MHTYSDSPEGFSQAFWTARINLSAQQLVLWDMDTYLHSSPLFLTVSHPSKAQPLLSSVRGLQLHQTSPFDWERENSRATRATLRA